MIIGFTLQEVEAKREGSRQGQTQVTYSSQIDDVQEEEVKVYEDKVSRIYFTFTISYSNNDQSIGHMKFVGSLVWKGHLEEIQNAWENEQLPEQLKTPVLNHIYKKCLMNAVGMADSLNLPEPVPMPRIQLQNQ